MARVFIDGFEGGTKNLWVGTGGVALPALGGWGGNYYLNVVNTAQLSPGLYCTFKSSSTCCVSMRLKRGDVWPNSSEIFRLYSGVTHVLTLGINTAGYFRVTTAAGDTLGTSTVPYVFGNYDHYQLKYVAGNGTGSIEFKFNGVTQIVNDAVLSVSSVDRMQFWCQNTGYVYADDIVVDDAEWPGATRIQALVPNGVGTVTNFSPSITKVNPYSASSTRWRLYMTDSTGGTNINIAKLELREAAGGASVCIGGTATSNIASQGTAANVFDSSTSTFLQISHTHYDWIEYDFGVGNSKTIIEYTITALDPNCVGTWRLEYYSAGTWETAHTMSNPTTWLSGETKIFLWKFNLVAELPPSDTDYVHTAGINTTDLYQMSDFVPPTQGLTYRIHSIQSQSRTKYEGPSPVTKLAPAILPNGGSVAYGPDTQVTTAYSSANAIWSTNPTTGVAWTTDDLNNLQSGFTAKA